MSTAPTDALELLREIYTDLVQGAIPNADDPWWQKASAALAGTPTRAQPAAQQGAYAALSESFLEIPDVQDESGINAYYSREVVLECIDAALASHGQAPAVATLPEGWVPLTITHEGQHPEEVAYGPQIMMDRLGKWLGKYFAQAAQADSVLEDAARYRHLRNKSQVVLDRAWFGGMSVRNHYGDFLCRDDALAALDTAIDAARAWSKP